MQYVVTITEAGGQPMIYQQVIEDLDVEDLVSYINRPPDVAFKRKPRSDKGKPRKVPMQSHEFLSPPQ